MAKVNKDFLLKVTGIRCPHWSTIALWSLGILVMTGLTVKDMYPILHDYFDPDENVQVKIETKPANVSNWPKLHLCMLATFRSEIFFNLSHSLWGHLTNGSTCAECEILANYSFDAWNYCPNITNVSGDQESVKGAFAENLAICFVNYLIENYTIISYIDEEDLTWNHPVIGAVFSVLSVVAAQEKYLTTSYMNGPENSPINSFSLEALDALSSTLISLVCKSFFIYGDHLPDTDRNACLFVTHGSVAAWHPDSENDQFVCMQVSPSGSRSVVVESKRKYFDTYPNRRMRFRIFTGNPSHDGTQELYSTSSKDSSDVNSEKVTITYSQQFSVVETRPQKKAVCYNETSVAECEWACLAKSIQSKCQCRFFLNRELLTAQDIGEMPSWNEHEYCDPQLIYNCGQEIQFRFQNCSEKCVHPCEAVSYQWQVTADLDYDSYMSRFYHFVMRVEARQQPYLEFSMNVRDFNQDLISKVGGVFNFYLGLSGLSIVFFLIYIFDSGRRLQRLKQAEDDKRNIEVEEGRRPSIGLWRFKWMQLAASAVEMSKETEVNNTILRLESTLKESEASHQQSIKDLQAQNQELIQEMKEIKSQLAQKKSSAKRRSPSAAGQKGQEIPPEKRTHKKKA